MNEDQDERVPVDYELELARGMAKDLLEQYPPSNDGSEDRMEVHAASTINWLVSKVEELASKLEERMSKLEERASRLEEKAPFAKGTFVTEQVVATIAHFHTEQFRGALEKIGHMFDHEEWYGENALSMRDIALDVLKAVDG